MAASQAVQAVKPPVKDSDGDNDGSKGGSTSNIGAAVILSLSNTAATKGASDPDADGK